MLRLRLKNKAFSLLEVLIAMAILSAGITAILQAFSHSAYISGISSDISQVAFLIEDKIQEIEFLQERRCSLAKQESFTEKGEEARFKWEYAITPEDINAGFYKLGLTINWQRRDRKDTIKINSYLKCLN